MLASVNWRTHKSGDDNTTVIKTNEGITITMLSENSVNNKIRTMDFPDFTHGKWATTKPKAIEAI